MSLLDNIGCPFCIYHKIFADRNKKNDVPCNKCGRSWEKIDGKWKIRQDKETTSQQDNVS